MNPQYANVLVVSSLISFSLALVAFQRRNAPGAAALATILFSITEWTFAYAMRWTTANLAVIHFWLNLTYLGIVTAPAAILVFAYQFAQHRHVFTRRHYLLLVIEPLITLIFLWTDPYHGLFFGGSRNPDHILSGGIWFYFNAVYTFTMMIIAMVVLIKYIANTTSIGRQQTVIILTGFLIPIAGSGLQILGVLPRIGPDITPFIFMLSGIVVTFGFFYLKLLDIVPIAHSRLFETTDDGLIVFDEDRRVVDANPFGRRILERVDSGVGQSLREAFKPWPELYNLIEAGGNRSVPIHVETEFVTGDFDVAISPIHTTPNHVAGWLMMIHDISELKHTEKALVASENKIRSLFHAIKDTVLVIGRDGRYLELAPTNLAGQPRDPLQIVGRYVKDFFPEGVSRQIMDEIQTALADKATSQLDYPMTVNGVEYWYSGSVSPLTDDAVLWIARDITERKRMEQDLRERETRLRLAQKIAHVGYWEFDLSARDFWASPEYYDIMGVEPGADESSLKDLAEQFRYKNQTGWSDSVHEWLNGLPNLEGNVEFIRNGSSELHILHTITIVEYNSDNKPLKVIGVVQDITMQKQVEKALEKRMLALTRPLEKNENINIEDLFNLDDLQQIQDDFSNAMGVASVITRPDGSSITRLSNFTRLCGSMIRKDKTGCEDCIRINATLSMPSEKGTPHMVSCPNTNLMHASAPIMVGGRHIANWLIGQVRYANVTPDAALKYACALGFTDQDVMEAFAEVPVVTEEKFTEITRALYTLSSNLSNYAYQNVQQARFITERKKAEEALRLSENKLRSLFRAMSDVIIIYGEDGEYREIASTSSQRYYRPPHELLKKKIPDIFPEDVASLFMRTIRQTLDLKEMTRLDYSLTIGGREYWFSANVSPFTDNSVIWVARDITDRKKVEDTLHFQSTHDTLTGLYNRQYYETEIDRLQHSRLFPVSIIMIDVDGLKWVNDHRGHQAGDDLLKRAAGLLKSAFRPEDMVARMGGDEFVVVLPQTGEPAARQALARLEEIMTKHNDLFPEDQHLGLSMGTASGTQGMLLTEVFKVADQAMYVVKAKKKEATRLQ